MADGGLSSISRGQLGTGREIRQRSWRRALGMRLFAVESVHNLRLQSVGLRWVLDFDHAPGQFAQLFRAGRTVLRRSTGERDHLGLLLSRQPFDLFDDFNRCHAIRLPALALPCKRADCAAADSQSCDRKSAEVKGIAVSGMPTNDSPARHSPDMAMWRLRGWQAGETHGATLGPAWTACSKVGTSVPAVFRPGRRDARPYFPPAFIGPAGGTRRQAAL